MNNQPPPLIPFREASRQKFLKISTKNFVPGSRESWQLPQTGMLAALVVRIFGTLTGNAGGTATYTNATEGAFNLLGRMRLEGNGGNIQIFDLTGFETYLLSHLGLERGYGLDKPGVGSSAVDPTLSKTPLPTASQVISDFAQVYYIPVNANQGLNFDTGLINLQAQDAIFNLNVDFSQMSQIYATNVPVATALTVEVGMLYYEFPDPNTVQIPPPLVVRTYSEPHSDALVNGDNKVKIQRGGQLLQTILACKIDAAYSSTVISEVGLRLNNGNIQYNMSGWQKRMLDRIQHAVDFPAGCFSWDFYHATQSVSEGDSRDMYDLDQYSLFEFIVTLTGMASPGTSTIKKIVRVLQQLQS